MTNCECELAGYCNRHKLRKTNGWHKLCQTNQNYFDTWEAGNGPGQERKPDEGKEQRRKKVAEATRRKAWVISWLKLLRSPQDVGIGDTANRLRQQRKKSPIWIASDAHDAVKRLLAQCSCSKTEAVARLNREYPY